MALARFRGGFDGLASVLRFVRRLGQHLRQGQNW